MALPVVAATWLRWGYCPSATNYKLAHCSAEQRNRVGLGYYGWIFASLYKFAALDAPSATAIAYAARLWLCTRYPCRLYTMT